MMAICVGLTMFIIAGIVGTTLAMVSVHVLRAMGLVESSPNQPPTTQGDLLMTATFIHRGDAIEHVPATDLPAGAVVVLAALVGIAVHPIPSGRLGALQVTGVFDLSRVTGGVIGTGFRLYWDEANQRATTDDASGANAYLGKAVRESGDTDTTVRVRLEQ